VCSVPFVVISLLEEENFWGVTEKYKFKAVEAMENCWWMC